MLCGVGFRNVVGDVGGKCGLAHGRASGENDEVGSLQAAHLLVEVLQPGRNAREVAVALIGAGCHVHRVGEGAHEGLEALSVSAGLRHGIERLLGAFDEVLGAVFDVGLEGLVHEVGTHPDEFAPLCQLIDGASIFLCIDDGGGIGGKPCEIGGATNFLERGIIFKMALQRHRTCELADADQGGGGFEDACVQRLEEMLGLQEPGYPVAGFVVHQYGAQQCLFRL